MCEVKDWLEWSLENQHRGLVGVSPVQSHHLPVCTLRWALRWDDLPYIFPQPVKGQQCLFSGHSCLVDTASPAVALLFRDCLGAAEPLWLSPAFNRQLTRSTFSTEPASLPPLRHLLPPPALGLHLFKSNKIIATMSKVLFSGVSFNMSSVRPDDGLLGTQSAESSTSDITTADPDRENRQFKERVYLFQLKIRSEGSLR